MVNFKEKIVEKIVNFQGKMFIFRKKTEKKSKNHCLLWGIKEPKFWIEPIKVEARKISRIFEEMLCLDGSGNFVSFGAQIVFC